MVCYQTSMVCYQMMLQVVLRRVNERRLSIFRVFLDVLRYIFISRRDIILGCATLTLTHESDDDMPLS